MKFETIIIGGGLSGLASGIVLAKAGKRVAIVAGGQSQLHFNSGSIDLLGYNADGSEVVNPVEAIAALDSAHPYKKVSDVAATAAEARALLAEAGINLVGDEAKNHYRLTPMGVTKPAWLTVDDYFTLDKAAVEAKKILLVNIKGYLDFPTKFIAAGLDKLGAECTIKAFTTPELDEARRSPSEMRASNIAKVLSRGDVVERVAMQINAITADADLVLLPAVLGIDDDEENKFLKELVNKPFKFVATLPPSVSGIRMQKLLRKRFAQLGGMFLMGDVAKSGVIEDGVVKGVQTVNLIDDALVADNYILATGSFMSHGLVADYEKVYEPVFGLDVDFAPARKDWHRENVYDAQPYMEFGVTTDAELHAFKDGKPVANLYAAGSVLSGHNALKLADGTGVSLLTAIEVAHRILRKD
jgi:glycerol-3-phosphate dehydrogenase subunit B